MIVNHQIPGRIRFTPGSTAALEAATRALEAAPALRGQALDLTYNPRTRRALLLLRADEALTALAVGILLAQPEALALAAGAGLPVPALADGCQPAVCRQTPPGAECLLPGVCQADRQRGALEHPALLIARKVANFYLRRLFMPMWLRPWWLAWQVAPLLLGGLRSLARGRLDVAVLDAAAIGSSLALRDFNTAGTIFLLLDISETLEEWTREKSRGNIAAMLRGEDRPAWVLRQGQPVRIPAGELQAGDLVIVKSGLAIPVDGVVADGTAMVNQSSMTGEPLAVRKAVGHEVLAGTVVEEGDLTILAEGVGDHTRLAQIAQVITESESMRAEVHSQAVRMADRIVPFSFILAGLVFAVTRNVRQAAAVLLADYSCAIKLSTPLAVRAASRGAARRGGLVKGGKHLEALARADAIILDKTGTLTQARPSVVDVCPVGDYSREYILRHAACLEEHFPHPVAEAVVRKAEEEGLHHRERHAEVEYILAHGISSTLDGQRVLLGSRHFVHEDEGVDLDPAEASIRRCADSGHTALYMAIGGQLAGVICIEDPIHPDAPRFMRRLENMGFSRIIMLTGDGEASAKRVAEELGIKEYRAGVLPTDKTAIVDELRAAGLTVAMVGDGINDSAALTRADVGVSMKHGADIAREACDVLLTTPRLDGLLDTMAIARRAMRRIRRNYGFIVGSNTLFIALGVTGLISPALLALLHNAGTVLTCAHSMRPVLPRH